MMDLQALAQPKIRLDNLTWGVEDRNKSKGTLDIPKEDYRESSYGAYAAHCGDGQLR
jgi:hypothetical protein